MADIYHFASSHLRLRLFTSQVEEAKMRRCEGNLLRIFASSRSGCHSHVCNYVLKDSEMAEDRTYTSLLLQDNTYNNLDKKELVREYVFAGYAYKEIAAILTLKTPKPISGRQVMRLVKKMGLKKRGLFQEQTVREALVIELQTSGICLGYRAMARRLFSKYGIYTARSKVAVIMKELDPDGVRNRSKHKLTRRMYVNSGPNYLLHIDGYDKLKRFGFAIHGGMCGFSRRVLWLKVNKSNNNPKVVAGYFLQYLYDIKGVPRCVRTDKGTENVLIANIQRALRWDHLDDMSRERSFLTGSSPSNQRIERWWRSTKEGGIQFWIDFFKDKESEGIISTDNAQQLECLRFCFTQLLQEDLNQCRKEWNQHKIRQSRHAQAHGGRPDLMFFCPELYGAVNYKTDVDVADLDLLAEHCEFPTENGCSLEKEQEYKDILNINGREMPNNVQEAMNLYNMLIAYE